MSSVKIIPKKLKGTIEIPPSKSLAHRAIIAAGLADGESIIENIEYSKDILATIDGMKSFGVKIEEINNEFETKNANNKVNTDKINNKNEVEKIDSKIELKEINNKNEVQYVNSDVEKENISKEVSMEYINDARKVTLKIKGTSNIKIQNEIIDCIESGSTLRFLIPIALLQGEDEVTFIGRGKLPERPLDEYYSIFNKQNIFYKNNNGKLPLSIKGKLRSGDFYVKGNISSQFITGLMFALPLLDGDSKIIITSNLESKPYVDLTIDMLKKFGIEIDNKGYKEFYVKGNQKYKSRKYKVEGDFSQAAFWLIGGLLGEDIKCENLDINSLQGDKEILNVIRKMGGNLTINESFIQSTLKLINKKNGIFNDETDLKLINEKNKTFDDETDFIRNNFSKLIKETFENTSQRDTMTIDASQIPDLVPILAVAGTAKYGVTKIINAQRVRIKECDRLHAIACELNKIGGDIKELQDGLIINGGSKLKGGEVESWNDHRIAMALGIASSLCQEPLIIKNSEVVEKSYPDFWEDFKKLGGDVLEWNMGK